MGRPTMRRITGGARASGYGLFATFRRAREHNSAPTMSTAAPTPNARLQLDQGPPAMIASGSRYRRGEGASLMRVGGVRETRDLTLGDKAVVASLPIREAGVALLPVREGRLVAPVV